MTAKRFEIVTNLFKKGIIGFCTLFEIYQGWQAYAKWGNTFKLRKEILKEIAKVKKKKIDRMPSVPLLCVQKLDVVFPDDEIVKDIVDFYIKVKNITKSEFKKKEEFRKNVALVTKNCEINIEVLKDYSEKTKRYINYLKNLIPE